MEKTHKSKTGRLKFKGRHYSARAFASLGMGIVAVIAYIVMAIIAHKANGNAGIAVGIVGMGMFVLSLAGFIVGFRSLKERDIFFGFSVAGMGVCTFSLIVYLVSYIIGVVA